MNRSVKNPTPEMLQDNLVLVRRVLATHLRKPVQHIVGGCDLEALLPHLTAEEVLKILDIKDDRHELRLDIYKTNPFA